MKGRARCFILCIATILVGGFLYGTESNTSPFALPIGTVVLDAGHGGHDPGATASWQWENHVYLQEKAITLELVRKISDALRASRTDIDIVLTRDSDTYMALQDRADVAAKLNPGVGKSIVFVSIHANSSPSAEPSGFEILVKQTDKRVRFLDAQVQDWAIARFANQTASELNRLLNRENLLFATALREQMAKDFPQARDRGVKEQDVWVLNASKVPSVLVEIGFISNSDDAYLMTRQAWLDQMADTLATGILAYFNLY